MEREEGEERERELRQKIRFKWFLGFPDHNSCIKRVFRAKWIRFNVLSTLLKICTIRSGRWAIPSERFGQLSSSDFS